MTNLMTRPDQIVGYEVLSVLGYGPNSTIYAVQDKKDQQIYALKRVVRSGPSDQRFLDQAINEHEVASQIDHPIIRKSFKVKRRRRLLMTTEVLLLMELVDGRNLVQERPPILLNLLEIFMDVCDGLGEMHKKGFVHADMKPNNVMITEEGVVKVIDFGQSCRAGTVKNRIQGTPDFIAPEQVKRRALSARTDIFNFGATMYWCVTDKHVPTLIPKPGNQIGMKKDMDLRPPNEFNPDLPIAFNNLLVQCLKRKPKERPDSMAELRARLEVAAKKLDHEQPARPSRSWPPNPAISS